MDTSIFKYFADIKVKEIAPGYFSKLIHTDTNTINFIEVAAGRAVQHHKHIHEQYTFVLEGKFELTVNGEPQIHNTNKKTHNPTKTYHSGVAVTDCKLLDIFSPVRE